jgi:hypothetical protein
MSRKKAYQIYLVVITFLNNRIDEMLCMKNDYVCLLFFFSIRLHVFNSLNELYEKLLFSMQILCIGMYTYMYP